jgi:hypothetical protein
LSPHYEVLSMQIPFDYQGKFQGSEWLPSSYIMCVFSSRTRRWEARPFSLKEELGERIDDGVQSVSRHAAYWHGALYVHCNSHFIMRLSSNSLFICWGFDFPSYFKVHFY